MIHMYVYAYKIAQLHHSLPLEQSQMVIGNRNDSVNCKIDDISTQI